jgi:hypothetical protein
MDRTFKLLLILGLVGGIAYFTKDKWYPTVQTWVDGKVCYSCQDCLAIPPQTLKLWGLNESK